MGKNLLAFLGLLFFGSQHVYADRVVSGALSKCLEQANAYPLSLPGFHTSVVGKSKSTFFAVTRQQFAISEDKVPKAPALAGKNTSTYFMHAENGRTYALPMPPKIGSEPKKDQCYEFESPFKKDEKIYIRYYAHNGMTEFGPNCGSRFADPEDPKRPGGALWLNWKPFEIPEYSPRENGDVNLYGNPDFQLAEDRLLTITAAYLDRIYRENSTGELCGVGRRGRLATIDNCAYLMERAHALPEFYSKKIGLGYFAAGKKDIVNKKRHKSYVIPSKPGSFQEQGCGPSPFKKKKKKKPSTTDPNAGSDLDDEDFRGKQSL